MDRPNIPEHLAVIPDGNRRWAKKHGLAPEHYYRQGGERLTEVLETAFDLGVKCVSLWIGSYANLTSRDFLQVAALKQLYKEKFMALAKDPFIHKNEIKIEVHGEWQTLLKDSAAPAIVHAMDSTKHYNKGTLVILVAYDGERERGAALQALARDAETADVHIPVDPVEANAMLRAYSWTGHLPDVDQLIRTGAWEDPHNSGDFLSFLVGNTQLAFPPHLWPDYNQDLIEQDIRNYSERERRLGT